MEIKPSQLRVFLAVAETGALADAAERVGRTPSAVSMTLKHLESAVGAPLFEGERKAALSAAGRALLDAAREQVSGFDRAMAHVRAVALGTAGHVELACVPSVATALLPGVVQALAAQRPGVTLDVSDMDTPSVVRAVERGAVEFGVAGRPPSGAVSFRPLFADRLVLVTANDHPLAARKTRVPWSRLASEAVIANGVMTASADPAVRGLCANAALTVRNTASLLAMVRAGVGVTVLPALAVAGWTWVTALPVGPADRGQREVGLIRRPGTRLGAASQAFVDVLERHVAQRRDLQGPGGRRSWSSTST
jgi:DNA-binding transcriptional LysR family regulator